MATPNRPAEWEQVSPGRYQRGLHCSEAMVKPFGDLGNDFNIHAAELCGILDYSSTNSDIVNVFRQAWIHVRRKYPSIACELVDDMIVYDSTNEEVAAAERLLVINDGNIENIIAKFGPERYCRLYIFPEQQRLMVVHPHELTEGRGVLHFYDKFLSIFESITDSQLKPETSGLDAAEAASRLPPGFEDTVVIPEFSKEAFAEAQRQMMIPINFPMGIGGHEMDKIPPGKPQAQTISFSEAESSGIIQAAKSRGITVTPLLHAAVMIAHHRYNDKGEAMPAYVPVDCRRYMGKWGDQPLTNGIGVTIREVQAAPFESTIDLMVEAYSTVRSVDWKQGYNIALQKTLGKALAQLPMPPPPSSRVDLSNVGRADDFVKHRYGDLEVERIHFRTNELFFLLFMIITSFKGKFFGSISFNDRYHRREEIVRFLRIFKSELLQGLGIEQSCDIE